MSLQRVPRQWPGRILPARSNGVKTDLQNRRPTLGQVVHSLEQACQFLAWDRRVSLGGFACRDNHASGPLGTGMGYTGSKTYRFRLHVEPYSQWATMRATLRGESTVGGAGLTVGITIVSSYAGAAMVTYSTNCGGSEAEEFAIFADSPPFQIGAVPSAAANPYTVDVAVLFAAVTATGWAEVDAVQFWALPLVEAYNLEGGCVDAG